MFDPRIPGVMLLGFLILQCTGWGRIWTTIEGSRSEGKLLGVDNNQVTLEIQGREYIFPMTRFSVSDRAFLKNGSPSQDVLFVKRSWDRKNAGRRASFHRNVLNV